MQDELIIQLENKIKISFNGDLREVEILNVYAPNIKGFNLYADIKSIITKSVLDMQNQVNNSNTIEQDDNEEEKLPLELFLATFTLNDLSEKINKYLYSFAKFDGEIQVNKNNIQKLNIKDYNNILERVSYFLFQI
jgi:hypothetical protein